MVTDKNTKQEILDEYKKLLTDIKNKGLSVPQNAKGLNSKNNKTDILSAIKVLLDTLTPKNNTPEPPKNDIPKSSSDTKPTQPIDNNKSNPKKEETDLNYLNQEIIEKIQALNEAKTLKALEYNRLVTIEFELDKFVSMINSNKNNGLIQEENQKILKSQQEENIANIKADSEKENQEKLDIANEELIKTEEKFQKDKETLLHNREIEEEAYTYKINKTQKEEDDAWSDEVAQRESAIAEVEVEIANLKATIDSKSELVAELQSKIDEIPTLVEQAKLDGATKKEKELGKDYGYKTTMAKKDADATIQALTKKIENLKEDYNNILNEKQAIQEKLDKAYEDSNKLYMQTVQSTGGIKILNNSDKN